MNPGKDRPMLSCGCAAQATDGNGDPSCAVHFGIGEKPVVVETPDLSSRKAICADCRTTVKSSTSLAFFSYRPQRDLDSFYCGCRGWD